MLLTVKLDHDRHCHHFDIASSLNSKIAKAAIRAIGGSRATGTVKCEQCIYRVDGKSAIRIWKDV